MYGEGISKEGNILDTGVDIDIINKSGAWFSYGDTRLGQGRENAKQFLKENPEIAQEIENKIRENFDLAFLKSLPSPDDVEESE
jgi:recombination protein RecA